MSASSSVTVSAFTRPRKSAFGVPTQERVKSHSSVRPAQDNARPHRGSCVRPLDLFGPAADEEAAAKPTIELLGHANPGLGKHMFEFGTIKGDRAVTKLALQDGVIEPVFDTRARPQVELFARISFDASSDR